jgi:hypothetical protein
MPTQLPSLLKVTPERVEPGYEIIELGKLGYLRYSNVKSRVFVSNLQIAGISRRSARSFSKLKYGKHGCGGDGLGAMTVPAKPQYSPS